MTIFLTLSPIIISMVQQNINPTSAFLKWFFFTLIGLGIAVAFFLAIGSVFGEAIDQAPRFLFGIEIGLLFGLSFGYVHWRFINQYVSISKSWILATTVSFMLAASIIFQFLNYDQLIYNIIHSILVGLFLGIGQWLVLRNYDVSNSYIWILFSVIGWVIGEIVGTYTEFVMNQPIPFFLTFLTGATVIGIGMIWLLKQND